MAIVTYELYEKEHLGIIKVVDGILQLQQLRFAEEIISRRDIKTPSLPQSSPASVEVAAKLMERYTTSFYIEDYHNEQLESMNELIERRAKGLPPKRQPKIASKTTPEKDIIPKLKSLLSKSKTELSEATIV